MEGYIILFFPLFLFKCNDTCSGPCDNVCTSGMDSGATLSETSRMSKILVEAGFGCLGGGFSFVEITIGFGEFLFVIAGMEIGASSSLISIGFIDKTSSTFLSNFGFWLNTSSDIVRCSVSTLKTEIGVFALDVWVGGGGGGGGGLEITEFIDSFPPSPGL